MKSKLMIHCCMDCSWIETSHKTRDGLNCPMCDGLAISEYVETDLNKKTNENKNKIKTISK